jgi:hypothetical protein
MLTCRAVDQPPARSTMASGTVAPWTTAGDFGIKPGALLCRNDHDDCGDPGAVQYAARFDRLVATSLWKGGGSKPSEGASRSEPLTSRGSQRIFGSSAS